MKKRLLILLSFVLLLTSSAIVFYSCRRQNQLDKIAKDLSVYDINIVYNANNNVFANQTTTYKNHTGTTLNDIKFHLYPTAFSEGALNKPVSTLTEKSAYPNGVDYGTYNITKVIVDNNEISPTFEGEDKDILVIPDINLKNNKNMSIYFEYNFELPNIHHRYGYGENTINLANFYPIAAVYDNEWDTSSYHSNGDPFYSDVANYTVSITTPKEFVVAHTGYEVDREENDNTITIHTEAKCVRDYALVLSNKFTVIEDMVDDTKVKYYYYKDESPDYSLNTACLAISTFNRLFGKYPYSTYSVVETNFVHGGMEYPNLVYISDAIGSIEDYQNTIIHETAHQWWYGIVGNSAYHYGWLDEGLTEYSTLLFYEKNPSYNVNIHDSIKASTNSYVLFEEIYTEYLDNLDTSLDRNISEYDTEPEYVYMAYVKGMLLFHNVRETIGDKKFFDCLKYYYKENSFSNVTPDTMIENFSTTSGTNLTSLFDSWISGKVVIESIN